MTLETQLEQIAATQFNSPAEREAFVDSFVKQATDGLMDKEAFDWGTLAKATTEGGGKAIGALGVGLLGAALAKGINTASGSMAASQNRQKFEAALAQVLATNKIVKENPARAKTYAESLFKFAPNVMGDANLLSQVLANVVQGEGIDPGTIKSITDLEDRFRGNLAPSQFARIG